MQIQREELTEGLPESNTATPLPPPLAGAPTAESGGTQPNTSNTALFEISDCGSGELDHPKRTARPCGPGGVEGGGVEGALGGVTFLTSAHFHLEITREVRLHPNAGGN